VFFETGVLTQCFILAKQVLYCFSHTTSPFCTDYFADGISPGLASNHDPPNLSLPSGYDYRHEPLAPGSGPRLLLIKGSLWEVLKLPVFVLIRKCLYMSYLVLGNMIQSNKIKYLTRHIYIFPSIGSITFMFSIFLILGYHKVDVHIEGDQEK
jgi:hypothetical protein